MIGGFTSSSINKCFEPITINAMIPIPFPKRIFLDPSKSIFLDKIFSRFG